MTKYITATQARKNFFKLVDLVSSGKVTVVVTHQDKPPVVMMSVEKWEKLKFSVLENQKRKGR